MNQLILVGLGGAVGSMLRYALSGYVQRVTSSATFPFGTVFVNLIGCFAIGLLSQLAESRSVFTPETRALVFVGVLGGFTTFSTFSNETMNLLRAGQMTSALVNVGLQVGVGLAAVWLGRVLAFAVWR